MLKPIWALASLALVLLSGPALAAPKTLQVLTTTTDLAYFAKRIGGTRVTVEAIAKPTENIHYIQVKPSLLARLNRADCFVQIGLELEPWVTPLQQKTSNASVRSGGDGLVIASTGCEILERPVGPIDRSQGDIHASGNPHIWLSARNAKQCAANIRDGLSRLDAAHAPEYAANYTAFASEIDAALVAARALLAAHPDPQVVQHHATFAYLFQALGVSTRGLIEPRPGIEPGAQWLRQLSDTMQSAEVRVVVTEPNLNQKAARTVAERAEAEVAVLGQHVGSLPGTDSWEALILENARRLAAALEGAER